MIAVDIVTAPKKKRAAKNVLELIEEIAVELLPHPVPIEKEALHYWHQRINQALREEVELHIPMFFRCITWCLVFDERDKVLKLRFSNEYGAHCGDRAHVAMCAALQALEIER